MVRGEIFRLPAPRNPRGHEQRGTRFVVIVQADEFLPEHRPRLTHLDERAPSELPPNDHARRRPDTRPVEQTTVVDPQRLGQSAGRLDANELRTIDEALMLVLGL